MHYTVYPRLDICDGTEPTIQELLEGFDSRHIEYIRSKGGRSNISLDLSDQTATIGTISEVGPTRHLEGYWPLRTDNFDYSGRMSDFDLGTGNYFTGEGLYYDSQTGSTATYIALDPIDDGSSFSLSCWFKVDDLVSISSSANLGLIGSGTTSNSFGIQAYVASTGGDLRVRARMRGSSAVNVNSVVVPYSEIMHAAMSWDGITQTMKLYINGELEGTTTGSPNGVYRNDLGLLGRAHFGGGNSPGEAKALLRNARFYRTVLTPEEIKIIYDIERSASNAPMKQTKDTIFITGNLDEISL